jgi:hypothetical protein
VLAPGWLACNHPLRFVTVGKLHGVVGVASKPTSARHCARDVLRVRWLE